MSELRQDTTTFDWVIIAKERAKRPHEFVHHVTKPTIPVYSNDCPFCPGNEQRTPEAAVVYGSPDKWDIRVVPNKFSALTPEGDTMREEWKLFRKTHGYGRHEVVIETPHTISGIYRLFHDLHKSRDSNWVQGFTLILLSQKKQQPL